MLLSSLDSHGTPHMLVLCVSSTRLGKSIPSFMKRRKVSRKIGLVTSARWVTLFFLMVELVRNGTKKAHSNIGYIVVLCLNLSLLLPLADNPRVDNYVLVL
jgi:hypothetical protein